MSRRESLDLYAKGKCRHVFQHSSEFKEYGFVVPTTVNSALVAQRCPHLLADTLNDMRERGVFAHKVAPVRALKLLVMHHSTKRPSPNVDYATLTMFGTAPYMRPEDKHTCFVERGGVVSQDMKRELKDLNAGNTSAIPCFLEIDVIDPSKWEALPKDLEWKLSAEHELTRANHKDLIISLTRAANLAPRSRRELRIPVRHGEHRIVLPDSNSWARVTTHGESRIYMPHKFAFSHATTAILEGTKAIYVDSNRHMPAYVEMHLPVMFRMLRHEYEHLRLPDINTNDKAEIVEALREHGVTSTMTIGGYCVALSFSFLIDVLCTGKSGASHFERIQTDVGESDLAFVLYARAMMGRMVQMSIARLRAGFLSMPDNWPPSVPFEAWESAVVRI